MPSGDYNESPTLKSFSNERAFAHIEALSKNTHYVSSIHHQNNIDYIVSELRKIGLSPEIQEGYSYSAWGSFVKTKNILARIEGTATNDALMLLTHYDSSPHSSYGASDATSGVATILEGLRAFMANNVKPKNDIIVLISDAEELGLNGAKTFVNQHPWAKDVKLVLNFEARGSGGPSFMIMEANKGNSKLVEAFTAANPKYPVATSLAYSIYKLLPNDTDLTVFRKEGKIQGFNFAFIDDHYDYHTALDLPERLDNNTLSHQASYLMPLLYHFSDASLTNFDSDEDWVYFNSPFGIHHYPFSWVLPLAIILSVLFVIALILALRKYSFKGKQVIRGFAAFLIILVINGCIGFFGWKTLLAIYPQYQEILQGFPYNGHLYIGFFICLSLAVCFIVYKQFYNKENTKELLIAPLFFWVLINLLIAWYLKGASFLVIPTYITLGLLYILLQKKSPSIVLMALLSIPAIIIILQFIVQFPVALGLKMIVSSTVLVSLLFGLLLPVFGFIRRKQAFAILSALAALVLFISAHTSSNFNNERPKPNSLIYLHDMDKQHNVWLSYDNLLDSWNKPYFNNPLDKKDSVSIRLGSKYGTAFKQQAKAKTIALKEPLFSITKDTVINGERTIRLCVAHQRNTNTIYAFSKQRKDFNSFTINNTAIGFNTLSQSKMAKKEDHSLFNYWVVDNEPLEITCSFNEGIHPSITFITVSHDLLSNSLLNIPKRSQDMIPKPFVVNDAILIKKTVKF